MALVTRQELVGGTPLAQRTIFGNLTGLLVHSVALAVGVSALFFLTFLPQFVDRDAPVLPQTLTLAAIHVIVGLVWLSAYAHLVDRARAVLTAPRVKAWLEQTTGAVLIAFGLRVAVERR